MKIEEIRELAQIMKENGLGVLELQEDGTSLRLETACATAPVVQAVVPAAAPAAAGKPGMTPEMLAILSAAVDSAMTELTPEMVAVISAAVDAGLDGMSHRIVEIKQSPGSGYAAAGRAEIFASHRIRPSH